MFSFIRRKPKTDIERLIAAQKAHTRAVNSNFSCLFILLLILFCPIWVPMLVVVLGVAAVGNSTSDVQHSPRHETELIQPVPQLAPVVRVVESTGRYHKADCLRAKDGYYETTASAAKANHIEPCGLCQPEHF